MGHDTMILVFWMLNFILFFFFTWIYIFLFLKHFLKLSKYDNTFTGDLEDTEQGSTIYYNFLK